MGILIIVIIKLFIAKVIRILNFSYIFVLGISSKGFKGLVKLYIIYSLLGVFQILTI